MELSSKARKELQQVIQRDYGVRLTDVEANQLGVSLLRLTKLAQAPRANTSA